MPILAPKSLPEELIPPLLKNLQESIDNITFEVVGNTPMPPNFVSVAAELD